MHKQKQKKSFCLMMHQ